MSGKSSRDEVRCWDCGRVYANQRSLPTGPICMERHQLVHKMAPSPTRAHERSRFFPGIAAAMAQQWGALLLDAAA